MKILCILNFYFRFNFDKKCQQKSSLKFVRPLKNINGKTFVNKMTTVGYSGKTFLNFFFRSNFCQKMSIKSSLYFIRLLKKHFKKQFRHLMTTSPVKRSSSSVCRADSISSPAILEWSLHQVLRTKFQSRQDLYTVHTYMYRAGHASFLLRHRVIWKGYCS